MTRFEPDPSAVSGDTPAACPFCGHDGAFDGQGDWNDTIKLTRVGVITVHDVTWSQHRCPECNGRFRMLTESVEV